MKHISIASLLCGTAIVLAPVIQNIITLAMVTHLLSLNPKGDYHLTGSLNESYQGWCLFLGFCLLATGTILGFLSRDARSNRRSNETASSRPLAVSGNA